MRTLWPLLIFIFDTASCNEPRVDLKAQVPSAPEATKTITVGDYLLVKGQVNYCPHLGEFIVEYAQVEDTDVSLLGHAIAVEGQSLDHVREELIRAIEEETGRGSVSLKIESISPTEFSARQSEIELLIDQFYAAIETCKREIDAFREWSKDVANMMYNKPFKQAACGCRDA